MSNPITNTLVLITGGNTGVGLSIAQGLLEGHPASDVRRSYTILLASRALERASKAADALRADTAFPAAFDGGSEVVPIQLDVDDDDSIAAAAKEIVGRYGRLDVLIHNAGIALDFDIGSGKLSFRDASVRQYQTNVISPHLVTHALLPALFAGTARRIIFVSSSVSSIPGVLSEASPAAGWPKEPHFLMTSYRTSKAATNMVAADLKRELGNDGFVVHTVCPGYVATGLGGVGPEAMAQWGAGDVRTSGRFIRKVVEGERDADEGKLINEAGIVPL